MTNSSDRVEIITSVQRRRRWTAPEKVRMVEETFEPGMTVSLVARRHGVAPNQLFSWRRLVAQGSLTAAGRSGATTHGVTILAVGVGAEASGIAARVGAWGLINRPARQPDQSLCRDRIERRAGGSPHFRAATPCP